MGMHIVESGHHEMILQLDGIAGSVRAAAIQQNLRDGADAKNFLVAYRDRRGPLIFRVTCINAAMQVIRCFVKQLRIGLSPEKLRRHHANYNQRKSDGKSARGAPHYPFPFLDRKSTRLNSSHLGISYAVFCLKKKTHE